MKLLYLPLRLIQAVALVAFCAAYIFMTGHVLHLPEVMGFQPVGFCFARKGIIVSDENIPGLISFRLQIIRSEY